MPSFLFWRLEEREAEREERDAYGEGAGGGGEAIEAREGVMAVGVVRHRWCPLRRHRAAAIRAIILRRRIALK